MSYIDVKFRVDGGNMHREGCQWIMDYREKIFIGILYIEL